LPVKDDSVANIETKSRGRKERRPPEVKKPATIQVTAGEVNTYFSLLVVLNGFFMEFCTKKGTSNNFHSRSLVS
jgi:hypothetical protein